MSGEGLDTGLSQAPSNTENNYQTERNTAANLGHPASETDRQNCEGISKVTKGLC